MTGIHDVCEREVLDLPCFDYKTTVIVELYRLRCLDCGVKTARIKQLPSKAPFSKRFAAAVGLACEGAAARGRSQSGSSLAEKARPSGYWPV